MALFYAHKSTGRREWLNMAAVQAQFRPYFAVRDVLDFGLLTVTTDCCVLDFGCSRCHTGAALVSCRNC